MISSAPGMLEHARIRPKFLHSNAISHKWAFGPLPSSLAMLLMRELSSSVTVSMYIIIYNLWLNDEGMYELNFDDDDKDIWLRDETHQQKLNQRNAYLQSHISYRLRYSLRVYASVLYLRKFTNFQIILRGSPVEQCSITNYLMYTQVVTYKPQVATIT